MTDWTLSRRTGLKAAVAFGALMLASGGVSAQQPTLKFGLAMPLTGGQALYGNDQVKAAQWAVDEINKKGGINGKKLEMVCSIRRPIRRLAFRPSIALSALRKCRCS